MLWFVDKEYCGEIIGAPTVRMSVTFTFHHLKMAALKLGPLMVQQLCTFDRSVSCGIIGIVRNMVIIKQKEMACVWYWNVCKHDISSSLSTNSAFMFGLLAFSVS